VSESLRNQLCKGLDREEFINASSKNEESNSRWDCSMESAVSGMLETGELQGLIPEQFVANVNKGDMDKRKRGCIM
jgi:hypothetical protein